MTATLQLTPMTQEQFVPYLANLMTNYAAENVTSGRWRADEAEAQAAKQIQGLLPDGLASENQHLFALTVGAAQVGVLWFAVQPGGFGPVAFVYDIEIFADHRRQGYATQALHVLAHKAAGLGLVAIRLHVFGHNQAARALYEQTGFVPTNIVMEKRLGAAG